MSDEKIPKFSHSADPTKFVSTTKIRDKWQRINTKLTRNHNGISLERKLCLPKLPHMKE